MRCVSGHQCNLYPYGGFFAKAAACDHFVIVDTTQYVKKEYHNRNRLKLSDGEVHWIRIPVKTAGRFTQALKEVEIVPGTGWQRVHRRTLELNYRPCPYFDRYFPALDELLREEWRHLAAFNIAVIRLLFRLLEIDTPISLASELGVSGAKTALILDICRATDADTYLHGRHGRDYADFAFLRRHGVLSLVQEFTPVPYPQPWGAFAGNLSVLDVLFNCGPHALEVLTAGNRVVDPATGEVVVLER